MFALAYLSALLASIAPDQSAPIPEAPITPHEPAQERASPRHQYLTSIKLYDGKMAAVGTHLPTKVARSQPRPLTEPNIASIAGVPVRYLSGSESLAAPDGGSGAGQRFGTEAEIVVTPAGGDWVRLNTTIAHRDRYVQGPQPDWTELRLVRTVRLGEPVRIAKDDMWAEIKVTSFTSFDFPSEIK